MHPRPKLRYWIGQDSLHTAGTGQSFLMYVRSIVTKVFSELGTQSMMHLSDGYSLWV